MEPAVTELPSKRLAAAIASREKAVRTFFKANADELARTCHEMARAFYRGGRLIPFGTGSAATDAAHAAVEFMHPVIVGKRALPAISPANDISGGASLPPVTRPDDIALAITHGQADAAAQEFAAEARRRGLLTISMGAEAASLEAEHVFRVPADDRDVVQEVQETAYHVLWELVHVFFEHPGLLADACITCGDVAVEADVVAVNGATATIEKGGAREDVAIELVEDVKVGDRLLCHAGAALEKVEAAPASGAASNGAEDPTAFLYPFLDREETDLDSVLHDIETSTVRKAEDVIELRAHLSLDAITACAGGARERLHQGGSLITFGNGGSSTDAQDLAADALTRGWDAVCLNNDVATVTAIGNDVGFDKAFSRQLIPLGRAQDIAVAISTSGNSDNLIAGLEEARQRQMLTVGIAGYDGGRMAELGWIDHLFVIPSDYIPRIQEAQATIYHLLLDLIGSRQ